MIRQPAVAGRFYPGSKSAIEAQIDRFAVEEAQTAEARGVVVPHAGYQFSGPVAARVFALVENLGTALLIGPNHGASGADAPPVAIQSEGSWSLPTGEAAIDTALAARLMELAPMIEDAGWTHEYEHSLEVQVPFIHHYWGAATPIVPIILARVTDDAVMELAGGIHAALSGWDKPVTLVASTDFSHYITHEMAKSLDAKAMDRIEALDASGLMEVVRANRISMCGVQPTAVVIEVCRRLGAQKARLIRYQTSGDTSGDYSSVVGYGGFVID